VLSGGGAKGVCHIGLIKALEERNIPIDYVAGTSMGAIIAGFYAAGYTTAQMEQIVESPEFQRWADGELANEFVHFYQNEEPNSSWFKIGVDYKKSITPKIPINIIAPYEMDFQFLEFFSDASAAAGYNFDSLFVPFRCV
jgi:NTE family protein